MSKIAFCSVGSADYIKKYQKKCIPSVKHYCEKNGIDYFLDDGELEPGQEKHGWYWRKFYGILNYWEDYDYVCIVDLDIEIKATAPDIREVLDNNSIFYVKGISNRPNSGFLIFKTDSVARMMVETVLSNRGKPLPIEHRVMPAQNGRIIDDNGYVIQYLHNHPEGSRELGIEWNCSQPDYMNEAYTNQLTAYL